MSFKFANPAAMAALALSGALLLAPAISQAGYYSGTAPVTLSGGNWKIDPAKSHFGTDRNLMAIERTGSTPAADANRATDTFVVVSAGKVYLATSSEAFDRITANGVKRVDYSRWKDMKLIQVGENAQVIDHCGFRCQSGSPEDHLTLSFKSVNGGMPEMGSIVVFNKR
jgi:hypothetical protein